MEVGLCVGLRELWRGAEVRVGVASTYAEGGKCVVSAQKQNPTQFTSLKFCFTGKHFPSKTHINLLYTNAYTNKGAGHCGRNFEISYIQKIFVVFKIDYNT